MSSSTNKKGRARMKGKLDLPSSNKNPERKESKSKVLLPSVVKGKEKDNSDSNSNASKFKIKNCYVDLSRMSQSIMPHQQPGPSRNAQYGNVLTEISGQRGSKRLKLLSINEKLENLKLSDAALAVLDYPDRLENWGPLSKKDLTSIQQFSQEERHQLEKYDHDHGVYDDGLQIVKEINDVKGKYISAVTKSLFKPLPFFVYQDNLEAVFLRADSNEEDEDNSNFVSKNRTALTTYSEDFHGRNNLHTKLKNDYLVLNDVKLSPIHATELPSIDVINEHSSLLKRQIKFVVDMLHSSGRISKPMANMLIELGEEQNLTTGMSSLLNNSPPESTFFLTDETDILTVDKKVGYKITNPEKGQIL